MADQMTTSLLAQPDASLSEAAEKATHEIASRWRSSLSDLVTPLPSYM